MNLITRVLIGLVTILSFSLAGQDVCEDFGLTDVRLNVFDCTEIYIRIDNQTGMNSFDIGGFRIFDTNDSLIGEEEPWFFTGLGDATHVIEYDTALFQFDFDTDYEFRVELWGSTYTELICEWNIVSQPRTTVTECIPVNFRFFNLGIDTTTFVWNLLDFEGDTILTEEMNFLEGNPPENRYLCMAPQCFTVDWISMNPLSTSATSAFVIVEDSQGFYFQEMTEDSLQESFTLALATKECDATYIYPTGIEERIAKSTLRLYPNPTADNLNVSPQNDGQISSLRIVDLNGRIVKELSYSNGHNRVAVSLMDIESGLYQVLILFRNGTLMSETIIKE